MKLRKETQVLGIQEKIFQNLYEAFGGNTGYWGGTREGSNKNFMGLVSNLSQVVDMGSKEQKTRTQIFEQLANLYKNTSLPENTSSKINAYIELFFEGDDIKPLTSSWERGTHFDSTTIKLLKTLVYFENFKKEGEEPIALAAKNLTSNLINPTTREALNTIRKEHGERLAKQASERKENKKDLGNDNSPSTPPRLTTEQWAWQQIFAASNSGKLFQEKAPSTKLTLGQLINELAESKSSRNPEEGAKWKQEILDLVDEAQQALDDSKLEEKNASTQAFTITPQFEKFASQKTGSVVLAKQDALKNKPETK